jgi:rhodanese-related sulfurtransferase
MTPPRYLAPATLTSMIHDGRELALLDVREAGEFGASHLLFATPVPYSRLELEVPRLVPRRSVRVALCDDGFSGVAELSAKRLASLGYTDVSILQDGTRGWAAAGYELFAGVNVPSKVFGELVEEVYHTPRITPAELRRMQAAGEDFVIVDGRPYDEYHRMNIPGGVCCPNAELPYRIGELVPSAQTKIIVNCAGRTRSILGAQTLINFGLPNPVYALENGTQGWVLAGLELERGASRRYPDAVDAARLPDLQTRARALAAHHGVSVVPALEVRRWLREPDRSTYVLDVRTVEEFTAGTLPGALHAPGGQLVQATDQWVAVRNARIVLVDSEGVRAFVVASWLAQLGCDAFVLEEGVHADLEVAAPLEPSLPALASVKPPALKQALERESCTVFDLRGSMAFRRSHIAGSRWCIRPRLAAAARDAREPIVLVSDERALASLAAIDLAEQGIDEVRWLEGGLAGWAGAGYTIEASPTFPQDSECIDYLFFVHDRHAGNRDAMKQYLAWETGLVRQLDARDRSAFRPGRGA